jgi:hypothetical protein
MRLRFGYHAGFGTRLRLRFRRRTAFDDASVDFRLPVVIACGCGLGALGNALDSLQ